MTDALPESEKIRILLAEHSTLRTEIIARIGHAYQMLGYALAAVVLLVALSSTTGHAFWLMLGFILLIFAFGLWVYWRDLMKAAARIREIELDINDRAKEDLLVWENIWGSARDWIFGKERTSKPILPSK